MNKEELFSAIEENLNITSVPGLPGGKESK